MIKQRSARNHTITLTPQEQETLLYSCNTKYNAATDAILIGDAMVLLDSLPNSFVDLLIVDPPYNLSKQYGENEFKRMSDDAYYDFTTQWVEKIKHTLKDSASIYVCCDWKSSLIIGSVLQKYFNIQNRITWQREKGRGANKNWKNSIEDIWFATVSDKDFIFNVDAVKMRRKVIAPYRIDGKPKDWIESANGNFRDTFPSNFWDDISIPYWSMPENTDHPTQKPEKLIAKLLLASSNKDDMVFDPFLGSGTTAVVAKKLGRHYLGIEQEPEYCALSQKRLTLAETDKTIQGYTNGVFWERNTLAEQHKFAEQEKNAPGQLTLFDTPHNQIAN